MFLVSQLDSIPLEAKLLFLLLFCKKEKEMKEGTADVVAKSKVSIMAKTQYAGALIGSQSSVQLLHNSYLMKLKNI